MSRREQTPFFNTDLELTTILCGELGPVRARPPRLQTFRAIPKDDPIETAIDSATTSIWTRGAIERALTPETPTFDEGAPTRDLRSAGALWDLQDAGWFEEGEHLHEQDEDDVEDWIAEPRRPFIGLGALLGALLLAVAWVRGAIRG